MNRFNFTAVLISVAAIAFADAAVAADIGVSLSVGQPGFYGQIDIGDYPQPRTIYRQPVMIERVSYDRAPIYLNVPPGHSKNWRKHCGQYNACGERVYFVNNRWYDREYAPRYQEKHGDHGSNRPNRGNDHNDRDNDHGGRDHGRNDHGRGHS